MDNSNIGYHSQQAHNNCEEFLSKLTSSPIYPDVKNLILGWKQANKTNIAAMDAFMRISRIIHEQGKDEQLSQAFNDCLIKEAIVPKIVITPFPNNQTDDQKLGTSRDSKYKCPQDSQKLTRNYRKNIEREEPIKDESALNSKQDESYILGNNSSNRNNDNDDNNLTNLNNIIKRNSLSENRQILSSFRDWVSKQSKAPIKIKQTIKVQKKQYIFNKSSTVVFEPLTPQKFQAQFIKHKHFKYISKILGLYIKSVITFTQTRNILLSLHIYQENASLYHFLVKTCQEIEVKRRKVTIFAPLNELIDKKYPLEQVGSSYIIIPDGYENYSNKWNSEPNQSIMNRKYVSVPLGSEVNFIINKKTEYEEQLFNYEDQRYEMDNTILCLKACIKQIKKNQSQPNHVPKKIESPILKRFVSQLYVTAQNLYHLFVNHYELALSILLPRLEQRYAELIELRDKNTPIGQQIASKNYYKSLDYRCYYFSKNDKLVNCPNKWIDEITVRKKTITNQQTLSNQSENKRQRYINSFEHVTTLQLIPNNEKDLSIFDKKQESNYPKYPDNLILFVMNFENPSILNDVLEVVLYHCNPNKKKLLDYLIFRLMRTDIKKKIRKYQNCSFEKNPKQKHKSNNGGSDSEADIDAEQSQMISKPNAEKQPHFDQLINESGYKLTTRGLNSNTKDSEDEFMEMIDEEKQPTYIDNEEYNPFEGPDNGFTFIGTRTIYIFVRYLLTLYQRFAKAKQFSSQGSDLKYRHNRQDPYEKYPDSYKHFLSLYTVNFFTPTYPGTNQKSKDKKSIEEQLRKLYQNNAFIFFTLDKLLQSAIKLINGINSESLTYKILKDGTKNYELGLFQWDKFQWMNVNQQLIRLYNGSKNEKYGNVEGDKQNDMLFRFTFDQNDSDMYISAWKPFSDTTFSKQDFINTTRMMNNPVQIASNFHHTLIHNQQEILMVNSSDRVFRGQSIILNPERKILLASCFQPKKKFRFPFQIQEDEEQNRDVPSRAGNSEPQWQYIRKQIQKVKQVNERYLFF